MTLSTIQDEGTSSSDFILTDNENMALWIRVGAVYNGNAETGQAVWVSFQTEYMESDLQGPVLISIKDWERMVKVIGDKIKARARMKRVT